MATLDIPGIVVGTGIYTTLVGGSSAVSSDDGDTSYMREHITSVGAGVTGYSDRIQFPATTIPGDVTSVSLVTVSKGYGGSGNTFPTEPRFVLAGPAPDYNTHYYFDIFAEGSGWTEIVTPLVVPPGNPAGGPPYAHAGEEWITREQIEAGQVIYTGSSALLNAVVAAGAVSSIDTYWTYIALRVEYDAPATGGVPPLRIRQRMDGLTGGAPRLRGGF